MVVEEVVRVPVFEAVWDLVPVPVPVSVLVLVPVPVPVFDGVRVEVSEGVGVLLAVMDGVTEGV